MISTRIRYNDLLNRFAYVQKVSFWHLALPRVALSPSAQSYVVLRIGVVLKLLC
ncbi:MAG: hypothetical protein RLZZ387_4553 [Chloroflexota bacterium]|jgi:hypothetical protein